MDGILNADYSSIVQEQASRVLSNIEIAWNAPHVLLRPRIFPDGDRWCCLLGENLQEGIAGFGDTPAAAAMQFDDAWHQQPTPQAARNKQIKDANK